ncbi:hypothetical protein BBP40_002007 [Aspergillus hancockii]|nr:hypothetical protein BBP40_002007 [Aspergillus hancockii]
MDSSASKKVSSACQRCRRQKLKCDVNRPCTLCRRAGVDCQLATPARWRVYRSQPPESEPAAKRARTAAVETVDSITPSHGDVHAQHSVDRLHGGHLEDPGVTIGQQSASSNRQSWNCSSTMALVDGAFHLHNAVTPGTSATNAIPGARLSANLGAHVSGGEETPTKNPSNRSITRAVSRIPPAMRSLTYSSQSAATELISIFPAYEAAVLLVDTYFDRVHWFMLIFHQDEFRRRWPKLYKQASSRTSSVSGDLGFISTFLMVIAIGLQYIGNHRRGLLSNHGIDPESLKERILSAMRTRLLDIISVSSLESVQMCVLLGTYYLYHGAPRLAWPVCGCGLRIAQALGLHRKLSTSSSHSSPKAMDLRKQNESRKRGWWATYEIETFCSMAYGYPLSIRDSDCDVEPLDPSFNSPNGQSHLSFDEPLTGEATLLSYKYFMSKLSVITKDALTELYNIRLDSAEDSQLHHSASNPRRVIEKVQNIDSKLRQWHAEVPVKLLWEARSPQDPSYSSPEEVDRDIGASGPAFENHIYQLQALTLKLAYENVKILVHRPLLSYKVVTQSSNSDTGNYPEPALNHVSPFYSSLQTCRAAAISISEISFHPVLDLISETYAVAFVSIHTFTAGVTLGILSSIEPLGPHSRDAKLGLHRLMSILEKLKDRSILAAQGLEILQRLTKLVVDKELNAILDVSRPIQPLENHPNGSTRATTPLTDLPHPNIPTDPEALVSHSVPPVDLTSSHTTCVGSDQPGEILVADLTNPSDMTSDSALQYMGDPALSEAIYDFDQVLSTYDPQLSLYPEEPQNASFLLPSADDGFSMLEQTWIWGFENTPP